MIKIVHFNFNNKYNVNIGDQAHVIAIQETLRSISKEPIEFQEKSIKLLGRQVIPNLLYYPGARHYPTFIQNIYRILIGESYSKLVRECNEADLILIGGGGVFMGQFLPFNSRLIKQFKAPLVLFGVGYNQNLKSPDFTERQNNSVRVLTEAASLVTVRDGVTLKYLESIGINSTLMCDPAIFLSEVDSHMIPSNSSDLKVGINIAHHGWDRQEQLTGKLVEVYATLIKNVRLSKKARFYYFLHEPNEEQVIEMFKAKGVNFDAVIKTNNSHKLKSAYSKVDLTISMMLHSTILAFGANTPSICIGYDKKNASFMELTGQCDRYISVDKCNSTTLKETFYRTVDNISKIKKDIVKTKQALKLNYMLLAEKVIEVAKQTK